MANQIKSPSHGAALPADDPAQVLALMDQALSAPGVTVTKLRLVRHIQEKQVALDTCTDQDLVTLLDCSERTAREAKQWTRQLFAAMHVCSTQEIQGVQNNNIHGIEDAAAQLARQQLQALDWGVLDGRRVQDLDAFIEQHGAVNVLYAVWYSKGKQIQNPPAFVTWWLRQGHQAPDGWLPTELRAADPPGRAASLPDEQPTPELHQKNGNSPGEAVPEVPEAPFVTFGTESRQEYLKRKAPETPAELQPLWRDLLAYLETRVRLASFQAWFEPLVLVAVEEPDILCLWAPNTAHADWVEECYARLLTQTCRLLGYASYRLTVHNEEV